MIPKPQFIEKVPEVLNGFAGENAEFLQRIRQCRLLEEGAFIRFCAKRGIPVSGCVSGDPSLFHGRGWLRRDDEGNGGGLYFHPFRFYPMHVILKECALRVAPSATLDRDELKRSAATYVEFMPSVERIEKEAYSKNHIVDLAILLEPVYWPSITGRLSRSSEVKEDVFDRLHEQYRDRVISLVKTLEPEYWRSIHRTLRMDAYSMDRNGELYLLLRVSDWRSREALEGKVSGALWLRQLAELIRRAFEEAHKVEWPEEDQASGLWHEGVRLRAFGSERPLDTVLTTKTYLAQRFGLFTGSVVRWYVEGQTEYHAIMEVFGTPSRLGVELVNLRGNLKDGRGNIALKLSDGLAQDRALRRFSILSFDRDVKENVKAVQILVRNGSIVGLIGAHSPDFEFANFAVNELAEIAARMDEAKEYDGSPVRNADWRDVNGGRAFEERYKEVSARHPGGLKGEEWGKALARYACANPIRPNNGEERPFLREIRAALQARSANYDRQRDRYKFDIETFEAVEVVDSGREVVQVAPESQGNTP